MSWHARMPMSASTAIPDELLQAILVLLDDSLIGWEFGILPKHGLTSCSLTCRYWARHVRPMLFTHLTLRSREDEVQLQDFLATPDFLGRSIGDSMRYLTLIYDGAASGIPWTLLRPTRSAIPSHVQIYVQWRMMGEKGRSGQKWPTYLLTRVLPRTPPPSAAQCITQLSLCNLALSIRDFLHFIRFLRFEALYMENVTFIEGEDPALLHALPALPLGSSRSSPPKGCSIHLQGCSRRALLFWTIIGGFIPSGQRLQMNDRRVVASIYHQLSLCADVHHTESATCDLVIIATESHRGSQISRSWRYQLWGRGLWDRQLAEIETEDMGTGTVHICSTKTLCPDLGDSGFTALDQLCLSLSNTYHCAVVYNSPTAGFTLLGDILEGRVLADTSFSRIFLQTSFSTFSGHTVHDIKAAPAEVVLHNGAMLPLTTMQRTRWLKCDNNMERESYLADLRRDVTDPEREHGQNNMQDKYSHT